MSGGSRGQRDSRSDSWNWTPAEGEKPPPPPAPRRPWLPILAMVLGLGLLGTGGAVLLLSGDDGENSGPVVSPTPSRARTATARATSSPTEEATSRATAVPPSDVTVQLVAWSRQQSRWFADNLSAEAGSYHEGESVPFLLRLERAVAGDSYEIRLRYQCATAKGAALDYLSMTAEVDAGSAVTAPGPGRARADATIPVPDDPSMPYDDGEERRFLLWGATFEASPQAPTPAGPCTDAKDVEFTVVARAQEVFLAWGAHLAAAADWGEGRGASSQDVPVYSEASIDGEAPARLEIAPEAVAP